jgi:hypothetical protein
MLDDETMKELYLGGYGAMPISDLDSPTVTTESAVLMAWIKRKTSIPRITEPEYMVLKLLIGVYGLSMVYGVLDDTLRNRIKSVAKSWNSLSVLFKHWKLNRDLTEKSHALKLATAAAKRNKPVSELNEREVLFSN